MENHVNLPWARMCKSETYLAVCALLTHGKNWQTRLADRQEIMRFVNYPSTSALKSIAREVGASVEFREAEEFLFREGGRFNTLLKLAQRAGIDRFLVHAGSPLLLRYMVLRPLGSVRGT